MTTSVPHRKHTMENAARIARELDMTVRLEADGAITFIPAIHKPEENSGLDQSFARPTNLDQWRKKHAGENERRS